MSLLLLNQPRSPGPSVPRRLPAYPADAADVLIGSGTSRLSRVTPFGITGGVGMLRIDPETVPVILTTTRIPGRISRTGTDMCALSGATFGASHTKAVVTGILAVT